MQPFPVPVASEEKCTLPSCLPHQTSTASSRGNNNHEIKRLMRAHPSLSNLQSASSSSSLDTQKCTLAAPPSAVGKGERMDPPSARSRASERALHFAVFALSPPRTLEAEVRHPRESHLLKRRPPLRNEPLGMTNQAIGSMVYGIIGSPSSLWYLRVGTPY